jgi:hypothetical protein
VKPSRSPWPYDSPTASEPATGPDALARTSRAPLLPNGTINCPFQSPSEGRALATLTTPPSVFRPNSAL